MTLAGKIQKQAIKYTRKFRAWVIKEEKMLLRQWLRLKKVLIHCGKWFWYGAAVFLVLAAIVITGLRILLPQVEQRKQEVENYLSKKSGYHITVEKIDTYWDGLHPGIRANGVRVYNKDKKQILTQFRQLRVSLVLLPLLWRSIEVHELVLVEPKMAFERLRNGRYRIRGLAPIKKPKKKQDTEGFVKFLFSQGLLAIENGEITWRDYKTGERAIRVTKLNLHLKNKGARHTLAFTANFPKKLCQSCSFVIGIRGNPLVDKKNWRGQMVLNAKGVNLAALPRVIKEKIPAKVGGVVNTQILSNWQDGLPSAVHGSIEVSGLNVHLKQLQAPIKIRHVLADTSMVRSGKHIQLDLNDLVVTLRDRPWRVGRLRLKYYKTRSSLQVKSIDLGEATKLISSLNIKHKAIKIIEKLKLAGVVSNLNLHITGKIRRPDDFLLTADLKRLFLLPYRKAPGIEGLSGTFRVSKKSGTFEVSPDPFILDLPRYLRYPVEVLHAEGILKWVKHDDHWQILTRSLRAKASDAEGVAHVDVKIPVDRSVSPWVRLRVDFRNGIGAHAKRYLPLNAMTKKTIDWFDGAIRSGDITRGYVIYNAAARKFPRTVEMGDFETVVHVRNADFRFLPGWPSVRQADVDLRFKRTSMVVTATSGKLQNLDVRRLLVQSDELGKKSDKPINVSATLSGDTGSVITVLRNGTGQYKDNAWRHLLAPGLKGSGNSTGHFTLQLNQKNFRKYSLDGLYIANNSSLFLPVAQLSVRRITGPVYFNASGVQSGSLHGTFLGGAATLKIQTRPIGKNFGLEFQGKGNLTGRGIGAAFGAWLQPYLSGKGSWQGRLLYQDNSPNLSFSADTSGLSLVYPAPLAKRAGFMKKITVRTIRNDKRRQLIAVKMGRRASGLFEFMKPKQSWTFSRGILNLGRQGGRLPKTNGLHISATTGYLDADAWYYQVIKKQRGDGEVPEFITRISGNIGALDIFNRRYGKTYIDLSRKKNIWRGPVRSKKVMGQMRLAFAPKKNDFRFNLKRLEIPLPKPGGIDSHSPLNVPILSLRADSVRYQNKEYGAVKLSGWPINNGWKISRFDIDNKAMSLKSTGKWVWRGRQQWSEINLNLKTHDLGDTLALLDNPGFVKGGKGDLMARLNWRGAPYEIHYPSMSGTVEFKARSGRFLQVKEGVGRMLGALNITSIMRYLIFDFRPIFGKGFAFKKMDGNMSLASGKAKTSIFIKGKSAHLDIQGDVNLAAETYNLVMGVTPQLAGSVAGAGALLWNPATAFWLWLTQKIFKRKIDKKTRTLYTIKGTWKDPIIKKIPKPKTIPEKNKVEEVEFES